MWRISVLSDVFHIVLHGQKIFDHIFSIYVENMWKNCIQTIEPLIEKGLRIFLKRRKGFSTLKRAFSTGFSVFPTCLSTSSGKLPTKIDVENVEKRMFQPFLIQFSRSCSLFFKQKRLRHGILNPPIRSRRNG